jgi:hypothetical protein
MSVSPFSAILYFLTAYVILARPKINWSVIMFFVPAIMLMIMVWYPGMVYETGGDVRYGYAVNPLLETLYAFVMILFMGITPAAYFMVYHKYRDHFGQKLKYFFIGSIFGIFTYIVSLAIMMYFVDMPLVAQTIPSIVAISFIVLGYLR